MVCNVGTYVYDDKGAGHFDGDFEHLTSFRWTAHSSAEGALCAVWGVANEVSDLVDVDDELVTFYYRGGSLSFYLREYTGGSSTASDAYVVSLNTTYYLKIKRDEAVGTYGTLYCYFYSDSDRTNLLDTLAITLTEKLDLRYLYSLQNRDLNDADWTSGWIANLDLQEGEVIEPSSINSAEAFGTPTVSTGPVDVTPSSITSAEAFGTPTVVPGSVTLTPSSIASAEAFGTPTVFAGLVIQPTSIASAEAFGTPNLKYDQTVSPASIASAETFGTPSVVPGKVSISPTSISSLENVSAPVVVPGTATVTPSCIAGAEAFGILTIATGPVTVTPSSIASAEAVGTPYLTYIQVVTPTAISSSEAFGMPFVYHYVGVTSHAVSVCSYGSSVFLFRIGLDGHLYRRESSDNGDTWGSWVDMGDISGDEDFRLACCFKDADEAIVLYSTGSTLYRRRLSSETWEAAAAWSNSLNSITGIAVTYMGDWNVAVTGTDGDDRPGVWTCILGDGYSGAPGTWYSLNELMIAEDGSGISYHFPTLDMPDVFRLFFIETYSETESYSMPYFTYSLPTAAFIDNLWREPVPFNLSSEFGLGMAHVDGSVYLSCPYGLWSAEITPDPVDLSDDLIGAHLSVKPLSGELHLILRNDDGRYNAPDFTRGCDIRLKFGYHTTEGEETAGYLPMATIDSIERTLKKGRSEVILHALDGWAFLHNWKARYQYSWAAGDKNVFQLLSFVFARAGTELSSYSTSSRITAYEPAFTIHPGERGITAVKRLLSLVEDVIIFVGDTAYIIHPQSDDSAAYAYGIDHKVTECAMFDSPLSINLALTHTEGIAVGDYRWSEIGLVYDRLTKEFDDNIASAADAHLFGEAILRDAELESIAGSIIVPMNVAHDLYDVVELTIPHLDIATILYRLAGIDFYWTPEKGTYNQRLILSEV